MTKDKFIEGISRVHNRLVEYKGAIGMCVILECQVNPLCFNDFNENFTGENLNAWGYWLNEHRNQDDNMTEIERRLLFLAMFEQWALCYETYLEY